METRGTATRAAGALTIGGDLLIRRLGYGAMALTGPGGWGATPDPAGAQRVLRRAVDCGVDLIDTADACGPEVAEELIADALHPYPGGLVIVTKGGYHRPGPWQWQEDARPEHLKAACEGSLRRLRLERIDLYLLHAPDPAVPIEDSVGALVELQQSGKIHHIGLSNVNREDLKRARRIALIVAVQNQYNLANRDSEDVLRVCERDGLAFLPWGPLAGGGLAQGGQDLIRRLRDALNRVARAHGATTAQVALAWLLQRSPVMLPIPGTSSMAHLEENLAAAEICLSAEELRLLGG